MLVIGTDVRPIETITVTKVYLGNMPSATTITPANKPPINGGESNLDGSVPDSRNRYFSSNLL